MSQHQGGRPLKAPADKLVPAKVSLTPARFDEYDREARRRGEPLAQVLRDHLRPVSGTQNRHT